MKLQRLFTGGSYSFGPLEGAGGGEAPLFIFEVRDADAAQAALTGMYLEPSLRQLDDGRLAYCLALPDRDPEPWTIPVDPEDVARIAAATARLGQCPTVLRGGERIIDLQEHVAGLGHDWQGRVPRALAAFGRGELEEAMELLRVVARENPKRIPAAHHLLGRCYRTLERLPAAIVYYLRAVRASTDEAGNLIPYAAGPLSDMGVAFKRLGEIEKAIHCFMHSLHLRPNHPEALLTFFSLFPTDEKLVLFGAARVLALGGRDELVGHYLLNYASARERDLAMLLAIAQQMSLTVKLADWPFRSRQFGRLEVFEKGLFGEAAPGAPPASGTLN